MGEFLVAELRRLIGGFREVCSVWSLVSGVDSLGGLFPAWCGLHVMRYVFTFLWASASVSLDVIY